MKTLFAAGLILAVTSAWAGDTPAPTAPIAPIAPNTAITPAALAASAAATFKGEVLEVKDVESYTYLRLKTKDGEIWAAVGKAAVKKGAEVTIENVMVMNNFESKTLKKTFPTILFGSLAGAAGAAGSAPMPMAGGNMATAHASVAKTADVADVKVPKASGPNARTIAEVVTKSAELKDKSVLVRGKVVKYNPEIMGKNWIHLRDGSGSAADNSNDVLVTTTSPAKAGDIVTVKGVVRTDKDFGAGYSYKVVIEEATLQK
jgi:DNA/RNA endonuclease YhcR with UshA esterase domain